MYQIDSNGSVASLPAPAALGNEGFWSWGNPGTGQAATEIDQDWLNMVQQALLSVLNVNGLAHSKSDYGRLWQALLRCGTFADTGATANHLVAGPGGNVAFAAASLGLGTTVKVKVAVTNSGAVDFNWAGLGALPVQYPDGSAIGAGEFPAGAIVELVHDGAGHWVAVGFSPSAIKRVAPQLIFKQTAHGSGNFVVPAGLYVLYAECVGAGGGGAGHNSSSGFTGGGGAAGGFAAGYFAVTPGQSIAYVVGQGGTAGAAGTTGTNGGAGATTSLGSDFTSPGGGGGASTANGAGGLSQVGVAGGLIGGYVDIGGSGTDGAISNGAWSGNGGASYYGGGTRGSATGAIGGGAFGSGGGGGYNSGAGSAGTDGAILIWG